jgi:hypothetical protein
MKSLIMMSIVVAAMAIPILASLDPNPRRGFRRALAVFALAAAFYAGYLIFVHPYVFVPHWP